MAAGRFDNYSTVELAALQLASLDEYRALRTALELRLRAECTVMIGAKYRIADDDRPLCGRLILVEGIVANVPFEHGYSRTANVLAYGRLNGKSKAGDGWTIKRQQVSVKRLSLVDGEA